MQKCAAEVPGPTRLQAGRATRLADVTPAEVNIGFAPGFPPFVRRLQRNLLNLPKWAIQPKHAALKPVKSSHSIGAEIVFAA